jgi:hypothetical protein
VASATAALTWAALPGAVSYNVYRDCVLIATTATPSYTDTSAPGGTGRTSSPPADILDGGNGNDSCTHTETDNSCTG